MKIRRIAALVTSTALCSGALLLGASSPAAAAVPSVTTPDGKVVSYSLGVGLHQGELKPASAVDSVWLERPGSTQQLRASLAPARRRERP
ncbi:hypothetical protein ACLQ28_14945 [Micromonospora sp. DT201]|uniref:hypothetical protein n=1 Tax=Micromonospora sp. DT201 TaxID=3393442 RepID=UPI003CFA2781